jgi:hypothetical protein
MILPINKRPPISEILKKVPKNPSKNKMNDLIQSLQYKNCPREKGIISMKK